MNNNNLLNSLIESAIGPPLSSMDSENRSFYDILYFCFSLVAITIHTVFQIIFFKWGFPIWKRMYFEHYKPTVFEGSLLMIGSTIFSILNIVLLLIIN